MPARFINMIRERHLVEYDDGKFDNWCIYLKRYNSRRYPPHDTEYFSVLQELGDKYGHKRIYDDFVKIYSATSKHIDNETLRLISVLSENYNADAEEIEIWFTVIYAGMIAEENKQYTRLGKRIKRLGMHQTLIDKLSPLIAANFSRGKAWRELDIIMKAKGF